MKTMILSLAVLALAVLGNAVELKNPDVPLIDLASSVVDSQKGQGGNEEAGLGKTEAPIQAIENPKEIEIVVAVRDREIRVNGAVCDGTDRMGDRIDRIYRDGMSIRLVDDYAEYNTYRAVQSALTEQKYEFKEEANE